jgi:hypothetical protein
MRFHWKDWRSPREVRDFFGKLSETDTAGDIYARSRGPL